MSKRSASTAMLPDLREMQSLMTNDQSESAVVAAPMAPATGVPETAEPAPTAPATESTEATEPAATTESAPANAPQRFAGRTLHSFHFQMVHDRQAEFDHALLVREEWENKHRYLGLQAFFYRMTQDHHTAWEQAKYWRDHYETVYREQLLAEINADSGSSSAMPPRYPSMEVED
eukprot:s612_g7.t1